MVEWNLRFYPDHHDLSLAKNFDMQTTYPLVTMLSTLLTAASPLSNVTHLERREF